MTEAEWLACADPQKVLDFLRNKASDRKLRLFACACCRRIWHLLSDLRSRKAVDVMERYADGLADEGVLLRARSVAQAAYDDSLDKWAHRLAHHATEPAAIDAARKCAFHRGPRKWHGAVLALLVRDLFGNPFRSVVLNAAWLTPDVLTLAGHIYCDGAFEEMTELADALEEAGCDDAQVLAHCRQPVEHVRGCWVVDLLLGKC
jgi:hypothetical protein